MPDQSLALSERDGLPPALRTLAEAFPRDTWDAHPHFHGMVTFWLERHLMFRKLHGMLTEDFAALVEKSIEPEVYAARLSRFGGLLLNELHTHHHVEDDHYFPLLQKADPSLAAGFEILDRDHHTLDAELNGFATAANAVIGAAQHGGDLPLAALDAVTGRLGRFLDRHLADEEEIVVPIILKHGPEAIG